MSVSVENGCVIKVGSLGSALFSGEPVPLHRYWLRYPLSTDRRTLLFGMQNPSKAGADESDPTVTRCIGFARRLGFGTLMVVNMAAGIATDPADLLKMEDPVGPENVRIIREQIQQCDLAIAAWGSLSKRLRAMFRLSIGAFKTYPSIKCLGKTKAGDPRHPLYLRGDTPLVDF